MKNAPPPVLQLPNVHGVIFMGHPVLLFGLFVELQVKLGIETSGVCFGDGLAWTLKSGSWS